MEKEVRESLQEELEKLTKNREMISEEELKTKYFTSYTKLLNRIKTYLAEYMLESLTIGLTIKREDTEIIELINDLVEEKKRDISHVVYKKCDMNSLDEILQNMRYIIVDKYLSSLSLSTEEVTT